MNYFELHVGDYEAATAHLSALEDGIYGRLLRIYYRTEQPLPVERKQIYRLARAQSKQEREAVDQVLADFFKLADDGWHQVRCDEEIARFRAGEPEREAKKANEEMRLKRHREERARLFQIITAAGFHAPWNAPMNDLRELAKRCGPPLPATAPATPATATQTPDTRHQTPEEEIQTRSATSTAAGRACLALKAAGLSDVNPGHPDLLALLDAGATEGELQDAAAAALGKGKGFVYALGVLKGRRQDAAKTAEGLHRGPMPKPQRTPTAAEQRVLQAVPGLAAPHLRQSAPFTIDMEASDAPAKLG